MLNCTTCHSPAHLIKAGFVRGKQRYYCKACALHFTIEPLQEPNAKANKKYHQTTIVDVAKSLGIAPSTVSRALNGKTDINDLTRKTIIKAAFDLDYKPNLLAQSLNRGETHTIGVIIPNIERPFFAGVLAGIQKVASDKGYRVMICQSNESKQIEMLNVQSLMASRVDGLLISHSKETDTFEHIQLHLNKGIPIVHFDRVCNELNTPKVIQEDFKGSFDLVEHLILQGCQRIAILTGPPQLLISQRRLEGYKAALQKHGIEFDDTYVFSGNFKKEDSLKALETWLALPEPPHGIFAIHYTNAIEMMVEAKKNGIEIPQDLAFVGFGDELIAELFEPSLTVYHLFPFQVGENAARILIENIVNKDSFLPYSQTVNGELIIRQSSLKNPVFDRV